jgi:hypothetical protein
MLVVEELNYGDYGYSLLGGSSNFPLNLSKYSLTLGPRKSSSSNQLFINPAKYSLLEKPVSQILKPSIKMPNFTPNKPSLTTKTKGGFLSSIWNLFSSLWKNTQPILGSYLQYKLASQQLKMQAKLMSLQNQPPMPASAGPVPASMPAGGVQAPGAMYPEYPVPQDNTKKYLLLGGAAAAAVLLLVLLKRD